jgi:hypothetical protein
MIALYHLFDTRTRQAIPNLEFNTLRRARIARRNMNKTANDPLRYVVIPGPAHPKYKP